MAKIIEVSGITPYGASSWGENYETYITFKKILGVLVNGTDMDISLSFDSGKKVYIGDLFQDINSVKRSSLNKRFLLLDYVITDEKTLRVSWGWGAYAQHEGKVYLLVE